MAHVVRTLPVILTLSPAYYEGIGMILTKWGIYEWRLRETLYAVLHISPKHGRLTIGNPRAKDLILRIEDVMALDGLTATVDFKGLKKDTEKVAELRNDLAHGVWLKDDAAPHPILQKVTGAYPAEEGSAEVINARIDPQGIIFEPDQMTLVARQIDILIDAVMGLHAELEPQLAKRRAEQPESSDAGH